MFNCFITKWCRKVKMYFTVKRSYKNTHRSFLLKKNNTLHRQPSHLFIELVQRKHDDYNVSFFETPENRIGFFTQNQFDKMTNDDANFNTIITYFKVNSSLNTFNFMFRIHNVKFLTNYIKLLGLLFEQISWLEPVQTRLIFTKPNFFRMNFQSRKMKSVKKSRKKMLYKIAKDAITLR